jgi:hypothetical protein
MKRQLRAFLDGMAAAFWSWPLKLLTATLTAILIWQWWHR